LTLSLAYRGGVVVYLNGKELCRGHLSKEGKVELLTMAEDYPPEAFLRNEKARLRAEDSIRPDFKDRLGKRIRRIENVEIPANLLRKGTNVLAVESHRTPALLAQLYQSSDEHCAWNTCGLVSLKLTAAGGVTPNVARPSGTVVWNCSSMRNSLAWDYPDPQDRLEPVRITGCRNGAFDGKVMAGSAEGLCNVKAAVSDLVQKGGAGKIPAAAIKVFYVSRDDKQILRYALPDGGFWDTFSEQPPTEVKPQTFKDPPGPWAAQPIVIKVRVAADAPAGEYEGKLTVNANGAAPVEVPVSLKVIDWKLPDPRDFASHSGLVESPESVAMQYKVPLWSEEHWKLLEESFKCLGEIGNRYVVIPLICKEWRFLKPLK
jgi:hypothetical protein